MLHQFATNTSEYKYKKQKQMKKNEKTTKQIQPSTLLAVNLKQTKYTHTVNNIMAIPYCYFKE